MILPIFQITFLEHVYTEKGLTSNPTVLVGIGLEETDDGYTIAHSINMQPPIDQGYGKNTLYIPKTIDTIVKKIGKIKV